MAKDMIVSTPKGDDRQQKMEAEANQFAAEILMPTYMMSGDVRRFRAPEIDHITALSEKYDVSKEAAGRRYVDFQDEPCALVFSKNGKISYAYLSKYFPSIKVWRGDFIPVGAATKTFQADVGGSSEWLECSADTWLSGDRYEEVYEQVLLQEGGYRTTLLTLGEKKDEDEEKLQRSWKPGFH